MPGYRKTSSLRHALLLAFALAASGVGCQPKDEFAENDVPTPAADTAPQPSQPLPPESAPVPDPIPEAAPITPEQQKALDEAAGRVGQPDDPNLRPSDDPTVEQDDSTKM